MFMIGFGIFTVLFCLFGASYYMYQLCKTDNLWYLLGFTWLCILASINSTLLFKTLSNFYGFGA